MNSKFLQFNERANLMITDAALHAAVVTSALALAISSTSHLPTTEVDNPTAYFNLQLTPGINVIVSEWCENMVIDPRAAVEQTRVFYLIRYTSAYPCSRVLYSANGDFFDTITGVNAFVPPELHAFLDGPCKMAILLLAIDATNLILNTKELAIPAMENWITAIFKEDTGEQSGKDMDKIVKKYQDEEAEELRKLIINHHVDSFNNSAKEGGSKYRAKISTGSEKIDGKSVDIIIYDENNKPVKKYHLLGFVEDNENAQLILLWDANGKKK